jgi:hypothetical protein
MRVGIEAQAIRYLQVSNTTFVEHENRNKDQLGLDAQGCLDADARSNRAIVLSHSLGSSDAKNQRQDRKKRSAAPKLSIHLHHMLSDATAARL